MSGIKSFLSHNYWCAFQKLDSEEEDSESADISDEDNSSWVKKLAEEAQNEFGDNVESYAFGKQLVFFHILHQYLFKIGVGDLMCVIF